MTISKHRAEVNQDGTWTFTPEDATDENIDAARRMLKGTRSLWWGTSNKALDRASAALKAALRRDPS